MRYNICHIIMYSTIIAIVLQPSPLLPAPFRLQVVLAQQRRQARPRREDVHGARLDAAQEVPTALGGDGEHGIIYIYIYMGL